MKVSFVNKGIVLLCCVYIHSEDTKSESKKEKKKRPFGAMTTVDVAADVALYMSRILYFFLYILVNVCVEFWCVYLIYKHEN